MRRRVMTGPKSLDVLYTYTYNSNNYHTFVAPKSAYYYVECWGGQGDYGYNDSEDRFTRSNDPGYGGYVAGFIKLVGGDIIYVYCGNGGLKQTSNVVKYNYNGGGSGHSMTNEGAGRYIYEGAGGGATDLRLSNNSDPLNLDSLKTRIMVSGGGGGGSSYISGHPGCVKYDKYVFTNTKMIDGNGFVWTDVKGELEKMPNPLGGLYDLGKGHIGSGYCRISIFQ